MASFTHEVNSRLAKGPLVSNGHLVNRELTSLVKWAVHIVSTDARSYNHKVFKGKTNLSSKFSRFNVVISRVIKRYEVFFLANSNKSDDERRNTPDCLDQYACEVLRLWNSQAMKQSMYISTWRRWRPRGLWSSLGTHGCGGYIVIMYFQ